MGKRKKEIEEPDTLLGVYVPEAPEVLAPHATMEKAIEASPYDWPESDGYIEPQPVEDEEVD